MSAMLVYMSTYGSKLPTSNLVSFPPSIILGYIILLAFAALPAPEVLAYHTKQQLLQSGSSGLGTPH